VYRGLFPSFSSAPCSQTPSIYVLLIWQEVNLHSCVEKSLKLQLCSVIGYGKRKDNEPNDSRHFLD